MLYAISIDIDNKYSDKKKLFFKLLFSLKILGLTYRYFTPSGSTFLSVVTMNMCDIRLKMHKYRSGKKSLQIRILHVQ